MELNEQKEISGFISNNELIPVRMLNTHCHIDHILGVKYIADTYKLNLEISRLELPVLDSTEMVAGMYGLGNIEKPIATEPFLEEGEVVKFGNSQLEILFVPGHSPGHLVFLNKAERFIIGGDVLFYGSIGRTDLPGGDHNALIKNIKEKLLSLGDDFQVYSGHGPSTNIGFERENNPFLT